MIVNIHTAAKVACTMQGRSMAEVSIALGHHSKYLTQLKGRDTSLRVASQIAAFLGMKTSELIALGE